jgi:hypothetical protein
MRTNLTSNARLWTRSALSRKSAVRGFSENCFFTEFQMTLFNLPHAPHTRHDTSRFGKPVVRFFPVRYLADIQASRQFIFTALFSTRKKISMLVNIAILLQKLTINSRSQRD